MNSIIATLAAVDVLLPNDLFWPMVALNSLVPLASAALCFIVESISAGKMNKTSHEKVNQK